MYIHGTCSLVTEERSSCEGEPITFRMMCTWSRSVGLYTQNTSPHGSSSAYWNSPLQCLPGKIGLLEKSSAKMQPTDHTSTADEVTRFPPASWYIVKATLTGFEVCLGIEHNLRGPVPPSGHILSQHSLVVMCRVCHTCQPKVTYLQQQLTLNTVSYT